MTYFHNLAISFILLDVGDALLHDYFLLFTDILLLKIKRELSKFYCDCNARIIIITDFRIMQQSRYIIKSNFQYSIKIKIKNQQE